MLIISVANQKGGVAKTTSAIATAYQLSQFGKTLAIDFDPQGNMTTGFGIQVEDGQATVYDVVLQNTAAKDAIVTTECGVDILPADITLAKGERELTVTIGSHTYLKSRLKALRDMYDFILIDCPPSFGALTFSALTASDLVIIPVQCQFYSMKGLEHFLETVASIQENEINQNLQIFGLLPTMAEATVVTREVIANLDALVKMEGYEHVIVFPSVPKSIKFTEASIAGTPIQLYSNDVKLIRPYRELAQALANRVSEVAA